MKTPPMMLKDQTLANKNVNAIVLDKGYVTEFGDNATVTAVECEVNIIRDGI
jgi:hypothetical protein